MMSDDTKSRERLAASETGAHAAGGDQPDWRAELPQLTGRIARLRELRL